MLPVLWFVLSWWMTVIQLDKLCFLNVVVFPGCWHECYRYERHYWSTHLGRGFETNYLTWLTLFGESIISMWWSKWCCVIVLSSIMSSLVCIVCKMTIFIIYVSYFRCTMGHMLKPVCPIGMCFVEGLSVVSVLVLIFIPTLYLFLYSFCVLLFSFGFGGFCWLLLWLNTLLSSYGKSS